MIEKMSLDEFHKLLMTDEELDARRRQNEAAAAAAWAAVAAAKAADTPTPTPASTVASATATATTVAVAVAPAPDARCAIPLQNWLDERDEREQRNEDIWNEYRRHEGERRRRSDAYRQHQDTLRCQHERRIAAATEV